MFSVSLVALVLEVLQSLVEIHPSAVVQILKVDKQGKLRHYVCCLHVPSEREVCLPWAALSLTVEKTDRHVVKKAEFVVWCASAVSGCAYQNHAKADPARFFAAGEWILP